MILARITSAVREQNWFAVILEVLIVLSGVVIGFQITAWNEASQERERERLILQRLTTEFEAIEERSRLTIEALETRAGHAADFVTLLQTADAGLDDASFRQALQLSIGTPVPNGRSSVYVELVASGDMRLVRSERLRAALVEFDETVRRQELAYASLANMVTDNARILLDLSALEAASIEGMPEAYARERTRLRNSPDLLIAAQLMQSVNGFNINWNRLTHDRARAVLTALE